ncbi:MAG: phosphopantetheine-binding protein [Rhodospirillaceae bacterium]
MVIEDQIKQLISEELGIIKNEISLTSDLIDSLGAEPEDMISIMQATELKFHIKVSTENWSKIRTIRDIAHLVDVYLEIKQIEL